jgi:hypothetical protein
LQKRVQVLVKLDCGRDDNCPGYKEAFALLAADRQWNIQNPDQVCSETPTTRFIHIKFHPVALSVTLCLFLCLVLFLGLAILTPIDTSLLLFALLACSIIFHSRVLHSIYLCSFAFRITN